MTEATQGKALDLSAFVPQQTADFFPLIPGTNKQLGWKITFGGPSHPKVVAYAENASRKDLLRTAEIEKARVNGRKWKGDMEKQPEESRREFITGLVARIVDWTPVRLGDKDYFFSETTAVELLMLPEMGPYVGQIVDWLLDDKAFMKDSALA